MLQLIEPASLIKKRLEQDNAQECVKKSTLYLLNQGQHKKMLQFNAMCL